MSHRAKLALWADLQAARQRVADLVQKLTVARRRVAKLKKAAAPILCDGRLKI